MANSCYASQTIWNLTYEQINELDLLNLVYTSYEWMIYQIIFPCIIVFGYCTNVSFIWTVFKMPSLHTNTYRYLVNLALSDLLFLIAYYIPRIIDYQENPLRERLHSAVYALYYFFFCCSVGTITLVSLERYLAICNPIKHHLIKGTKRTYRLICSVWCIAVCLALPYLFVSYASSICIMWPDDSVYADYPNQYAPFGSPHWSLALMLTLNLIVFFLLMIFNNFIFIRIYFALRERQHKNLGLNLTFDLQLRQVAHMLIVNGVFFFVCCFVQILITPLTLLLTYLGNDIPLSLSIWGILTDIMLGVNACMNPVLYLITNKRYRHAFKTAVFTWSNRHRETEIAVNSINLQNINRI